MAKALQGPAPPGQLPGAMTAMGLAAAGPFRQLAALIVLPIACAWAGALLARRLAGSPPWAPFTAGVALASAPLTLVHGGGWADVMLHGVIAAAAVLLAGRQRQHGRDGAGGPVPDHSAGPPPGHTPGPAPDQAAGLVSDHAGASAAGPPPARAAAQSSAAARPGRRSRLSRRDLLLLPTVLPCYFAILDLAPAGSRPVTCLLAAAMVTLAVRLAAGRLAALRHPGLALAPAPLAVLLELQWLPPAAAATAALAWIVAAPLAVALLLRTPASERRLRAAVALAIYPLFVLAYPLALLGVGSPPHLDFFEDGHELLPAAEMLHGRRPYADVVPVHGLISDGGLDLLVMQSGHASTADLLRVRRVARCASFPAIYAIAWAATGAAEAGLLGALLSVALFPSMGLRPAIALFALAAAATATRRRSRRWLAAAGAAAVLAFLGSPDFAACSVAAALVAAAWQARRARAWAPLAALAAGAAAAAAAMLAAFAVMGFAGAFLRVTFRELPAAGQAYVIGPLTGPACLRTLATSLPSWVQPECVAALLWILAVVATAAALARAPFAAATRRDGVWLIGLWIALAGAAYAERRHVYTSFAMAAFLASALFLLARRRERCAALALALAVGWLANPLGHVLGLATSLRASRGETAAGGVELKAIPRCRGVLLDPAVRPAIHAVKHFVEGTLHPGETWLDFTNHPVLYYFLDRRCPLRHTQIPFVEGAAAQREVVAMLERDPSVRAALVDFPDWFTAIDGVPNRVRAPLVWAYLEQHFAPAFADRGVVFWTRR